MSDTAPQQSGLKILVVDSDRAFHDLANAAAGRIPKAQILCCRNPGEAIHKLDQFVPTLIIIDGLLNGAAGINFVKRVRAGHTPAADNTLVVFVARDFTGGLSGRMCEVGCHGIVRKPMSVDGLVRALARALKSPVPFVIGGSYLGPDRRAPGETGTHTPERRSTPARGGWTGTPALFYRPDQLRPVVRRPAAASRPSGPAPTQPSAGIAASDSGPATPTPAVPAQVLPAAASVSTAAPRGSPEFIVPASPQQPQVRPAVREIEPAGPQRPSVRPAAREIEPTPPQRPPERPAVEPAAASVAAPGADNGFDLGAAVQQHREWMASNGTSGARANLAGLSLSGAVLKGQNLAKANLRGTNLMNADLRSSVLVDADLRNACLAQALMDEAQLAGAKIRHADLQFAKLPTAGLQGSDLAGADLRGAILAGADLAGANLLGANVRGADLTALNLTQKQLDRAFGDATTQLPPGLFVGRSDT